MTYYVYYLYEQYFALGSSSKIFKLKNGAIPSQNLREEVFAPNVLNKKKSKILLPGKE